MRALIRSKIIRQLVLMLPLNQKQGAILVIMNSIHLKSAAYKRVGSFPDPYSDNILLLKWEIKLLAGPRARRRAFPHHDQEMGNAIYNTVH